MTTVTEIDTYIQDWEASNGEGLPRLIVDKIESLLDSDLSETISPEFWHRFLNISGHHSFIKSLENSEDRYRWAELTFKIISLSNYTLKIMFDNRVRQYPDRILFQESIQSSPVKWNYKQIDHRIKRIAATFYKSVNTSPVVAIFTNNSISSACCDLACLLYDIVVLPLNFLRKKRSTRNAIINA